MTANDAAIRVNRPARAAVLLLCLTMLSTCLLGGTYAKFYTTETAGDAARVAAYVFEVTDGKGGSFDMDLSGIRQPGNSDEFTIQVTNFRDGAVSEVAQSYALYLSELGSLPLTYSLADQAGSVVSQGVLADGGEGAETVDEDAVTATATGTERQEIAAGSLKAGSPETQTYTLTVTWPATENSLSYAQGVATLRVEADAQQID